MTQPDESNGGRVRLAFILAHLKVGGIERAVTNWLRHIDRRKIEPTLILQENVGHLLAEIGNDVDVIGLGGGRALYKPLQLSRLISANRYQVVYSGTNTVNLLCLASNWILGSRAPKLIISEHSSPREYIAGSKLKFARRATMKLLYPRADAIAVPVAEIGNELEKGLNVSSLPIVTLPNPVYERSHLRPRASEPVGAFHFISAGRLVAAKAFDLLIDAFAEAASQLPDSRLTIFGEGEERERLMARIGSHGLGHRIALPGLVGDLPKRMAEAHSFVLSSRREGFGNVAIEAMAIGLPVIATDCTGPKSILKDGALGLVVPREDVHALAEAMLRMARDDALRRRLSATGPTRAEDFDAASATRVLEDVVLRLAREPTH